MQTSSTAMRRDGTILPATSGRAMSARTRGILSLLPLETTPANWALKLTSVGGSRMTHLDVLPLWTSYRVSLEGESSDLTYQWTPSLLKKLLEDI